ncbi:NAD(P)H-dependent oxidoreductase [Thermodesulfobacteriota bacterium]
MMRVLGVSASLRNIRRAAGSEQFVKEIDEITSFDHLMEYLKKQANFGLSAFIEAGRKDGKSFDEIYRNLRRLSTKFGMSNSEVMLAAGLWGARKSGAEIDHLSLSDYFEKRKLDTKTRGRLLKKIKEADGILLSGPVYFGDRSSLAHDFLQELRKTDDIVKNKIFAGIAVGAKRNGGQETCLIYQMIDFLNLGMLAVGNDDKTTAQYGGTGHAGDIGSAAEDPYGIETSIGTGKRLTEVLKIRKLSKQTVLKDKPRIGIVILQDLHGRVKKFVEEKILKSRLSRKADFKFFYFADETVRRCIACDMCPKTIDKDEIYRCIIKEKHDVFVRYHKEIVELDALIVGGYSPNEFRDLHSVYQSFMERTRYLRRGDYVFSNLIVAPFVIQEIGSRENLQTRIHTSIIRHHTVVHQPIIFHTVAGKMISFRKSFRILDNFLDMANAYTSGRIMYYCNFESYSNYTPFGYTLSSERDRLPLTMDKRRENMINRKENFKRMLRSRIM